MKHSKSLLFVSALYVFLGIILLSGSLTFFNKHLVWGAAFSIFISFVHFFIAWGIWHKKKWAPFLGLIFEIYLIINFFIYILPLINTHILIATPVSYDMLVFVSFVPLLLLATCIMSFFIIKREHFIN